MRKLKAVFLALMIAVLMGNIPSVCSQTVFAKTTELKSPVVKNFKPVTRPETKLKGKKIYRLRWSKVAGASAYQLSIKNKKTDGSWGTKRITYTRNTSFDYDFINCKGIKIKVRGFKTVNNKKVFGKWSINIIMKI